MHGTSYGPNMKALPSFSGFEFEKIQAVVSKISKVRMFVCSLNERSVSWNLLYRSLWACLLFANIMEPFLEEVV